MGRLLLPVAFLLGVCGAAPAAAQVVTLRPYPGLSLRQGPQLAGEQVMWAQERCVAGCGVRSSGGIETLFAVRSAGSAGPTRTLFRTRVMAASASPNYFDESFSFLASEHALVTLRATFRGDKAGGHTGGVVVRVGTPGTPRPVLVDCSAPNFWGGAPMAIDGNRVAYDPDPCDDLPRLVVRDLGTGATVALPEPAGSVLMSLRDRFVAWIAGLGRDPRLVVHDLMAGTTAYSAPAPGVVALDVDADGTVAAVRGYPGLPCSPGRLVRYSVAAPAPADLGPACGTGVAIDAGRIVYMGRERSSRTLSAVGADGAAEDLVRFGRVRPGRFDFAAGRIAWAARDCGGGAAIFTAGVNEAPLGAGPTNCRARFASRTVPVRRGIATLRLRCPRGCTGEVSLRHMGRGQFSLLRGESEAKVRLRGDVRARLERLGSLPALAKVVTFDRADDRAARSRAVKLVARQGPPRSRRSG